MENDNGTATTTCSRDYRADWQAFAANAIPTKGTAIPPLERFLAANPQTAGSVTRLLDLGCGSGALSHDLADRGYDVVGVDINQAAIEQARGDYKKEGPQLRFQVEDSADANGLDLPSKFHLVVCQLVISVVGGIQERKQLLVNACKALLPGHHLYLSASGVSDAINDQYAKLYAQDALRTGEDYTYYSRDTNGTILYETHHFSAPELQSLMEDAGFEEVSIETIREASSRRPDQAAYFHYATARKKR